VHPGLCAAPFRYRDNPVIFWECGGGGIAYALFAEGDEQPRAKTGPAPGRAWNREQAGGRCARCAMAVSKAARAGTGARSWAMRACPRSAWGPMTPSSVVRGVAALMAGIRWAMTVRQRTCCARTKVARVARRALRRLEGQPATQEVAAERGVFLLKPMSHVWKRGREGTGQAVGEPPCVTDHTAPVLNELDEGAPGGALGPERLQLVALGEQQCEL
jgi:hypothetical protein